MEALILIIINAKIFFYCQLANIGITKAVYTIFILGNFTKVC